MSTSPTQAAFDPTAVETFHFRGITFDRTSRVVTFTYALDDAPTFTETLTFPKDLPIVGSEDAIHACLQLAFWVSGISYYKTAIPQTISADGHTLHETDAAFLKTLYKQGLGEFSHQNTLPLVEAPFIPTTPDNGTLPAATTEGTNGRLVLVGGGKDSIVSIETLRKHGGDTPITLFSVGTPTPILETTRVAGLPHLSVQRELSPNLFELNKQGALNGHVPSTAIISSIALIAATLFGFEEVILSNERSANSGNVEYHGETINHQYSKSFAFEQLFRDYLNTSVVQGINYYSLLRPFSELCIAKAFAQHEPYFDVFTSCNRAFTIAERPSDSWCGDCPKCHFVFLILAPFLPKERLLNIFPTNLLNTPENESAYDELLGIRGHKPFECVGEVDECRVAMHLLTHHNDWQDDTLVQHYANTETVQSVTQELIDHVFAASTEHNLPEDLAHIDLC